MYSILRIINRSSIYRDVISLRAPSTIVRFKSTPTKDLSTPPIQIPSPPETVEDFCCPDPANWQSYGFDYENKTEDRNLMRSSFFVAVTLCLVGGGFLYMYMPDVGLRDWAQREAFLELRRRESFDGPLIDPNYVDPEKMSLPADDALEDVEIII